MPRTIKAIVFFSLLSGFHALKINAENKEDMRNSKSLKMSAERVNEFVQLLSDHKIQTGAGVDALHKLLDKTIKEQQWRTEEKDKAYDIFADKLAGWVRTWCIGDGCKLDDKNDTAWKERMEAAAPKQPYGVQIPKELSGGDIGSKRHSSHYQGDAWSEEFDKERKEETKKGKDKTWSLMGMCNFMKTVIDLEFTMIPMAHPFVHECRQPEMNYAPSSDLTIT